MTTDFLTRLDPERSMQDLETRAANAYRHVRAARATGDADKRDRAIDRLMQRWAQWMQLRPEDFDGRSLYVRWREQAYDALDGLTPGPRADDLAEWLALFSDLLAGTPLRPMHTLFGDGKPTRDWWAFVTKDRPTARAAGVGEG